MPYVISPITGNRVQVTDNSPLLNTWQQAPNPTVAPDPNKSQINQQGTGFSGQLNPQDFATFTSFTNPDDQMAWLAKNVTPAANPSSIQSAPVVYGGYTYGTDPVKDKQLLADQKLYATDPAAKQAEIERALAVYQGQKSRGEDASAAFNYLKKNLGVDPDNPNVRTTAGGTASVPAGLTGQVAPGQVAPGQTDYMALLKQYLDQSSAQQQQQANQFKADNLSYINQMYDNRQAAETSALDRALQTAQQGLNSTETAAKQNAVNQRNQADIVNLQNLQRMKEALANAGQNGGTNITAQSNLNAQRMGALGDINQQEGNVLNDISQRRADLNNATAEQKLALIQELQANKSRDLLALNQYMDQRGIQLNQQDYQRFQDMINNQFNQSQLTGNLNGQRTIAGQQLDFNMSPNNPANIAQNLQNQLAQLQLDQFPEQAKAQAKLLEQQLKSGDISNEIAQFNLDQLKDPNSPANQVAALDLQIKQLDAKNLPEQQKLELQQLRKQIAQIGAAPYRSQDEIDLDKVKLETAREQLKQLQNPPAETPAATKIDAKTSADNYTYFKSQLDSKKGATPEQQTAYVQSLKDYLTDSDYKKLQDYLNNF